LRGEKKKKNLPVLAPKSEFIDVRLVLLHYLEAFKCWVCVSQNHPAKPPNSSSN